MTTEKRCYKTLDFLFKRLYQEIDSNWQIKMPSLTSPCCVYGNPCFSVCISPTCKKFGMICQKGYETKEQCYLFHQHCSQIKWSELQKITQQNVSTSTQQFLHFRLKVQQTFIKAIHKIKQEQLKFRIWAKTFGQSMQVMNLIKLINDNNYEQICGNLLAPVVHSYFSEQNTISRPPQIVQEQLREIQQKIEKSLQNIASLYLRTIKKKLKQQYSLANLESAPSSTFIKVDNDRTLSKSHKYPSQASERNQKIFSTFQINGKEKVSHKRYENQGNVPSENATSTLNSPVNALTRSKLEMMNKFNSKIYKQVEKVKKLFTHGKPISFKLLYRASEHNFSVEEFHRLCDNTANTLVLVETQFGKVIGGFTPMQWKSNKKQWVADKNKISFIFSLSSNERYDLNLPQFAISCNGQKGPIFGCCDICIVDSSNKQKSSAEFPISYNLNKKYHRGDQASISFTGHPKGHYRTKQWEVFKVQFE